MVVAKRESQNPFLKFIQARKNKTQIQAISFQIKPRAVFGFPYLMIELFYIGEPVVQTDG